MKSEKRKIIYEKRDKARKRLLYPPNFFAVFFVRIGEIANFALPLFFQKTYKKIMQHKLRSQEDYYKESKRLRQEVLQQAELIKGHPLRFSIVNGICMDIEISKTDLKTIVSKASRRWSI